jgi:hypothetical protein
MSYGTHLSNFAGHKKEWPVYMTIGKPSAKIHQIVSMNSVIMVALLLILIKNRKIPQMMLDEQRHTNREVRNDVVRRVLYPLTCRQNSCAPSWYYNILCADGTIRHSKPVLVSWLADCPEYSDLHHPERQV